MSSELQIPQMRDPWMVAAFDGWNDAADAATGLVDHLIEHWQAELLLELEPEEFYVLTDPVTRPQLISRSGLGHDADDSAVERAIIWPTPRIFIAKPPHSERDVLLLRAPEPNMRWKTFCSTVLAIAAQAGVHELFTIGALLADTPHTRGVPVTGMSADPHLMERMMTSPSRYSGPIGITSILGEIAQQMQIATASVWAAVPHYLAEPPCPKATFALLRALEDGAQTQLPEGTLAQRAEAWQRGADEVAQADNDLYEYVTALESEHDSVDLGQANGEAIAREFERFLRRRSEGN